MVEREQRGHLFDARYAPACPEVKQDNVAAVAGQMNGGRAVGDGEIGGNLAGLGGMRAAIARRQRSQSQKEDQDEAAREPHLLIIRSERAGSETVRRDEQE
jgi:hypothetical protein